MKDTIIGDAFSHYNPECDRAFVRVQCENLKVSAVNAAHSLQHDSPRLTASVRTLCRREKKTYDAWQAEAISPRVRAAL